MLSKTAPELTLVEGCGVYASWGEIAWPPTFPTVTQGLPLYVGKADTDTLGQRARSFHLSRTRGSALRRSLAAVLVGDELDLQSHDVRDPRSWGAERRRRGTPDGAEAGAAVVKSRAVV